MTIRLPVAEWRFLNAAMQWVVEPGAYSVMVGSSSRGIRLRGRVVVGGR